MARKYTKVEGLTGVIRARKVAGETNRAIGESYSLSLKQVKGLVSRQNRKERMLAAGYVLRPKGRLRKEAASKSEKRRQTYGIRRVRRWIQRQTGKSVNLKAILCLMRKPNLLSVVRRRRPYTRCQQAVHKYPNLLNRRFDQVRPNQFWVTDITYIPIPGSMLYLCAVLDLCEKVVLNWKIGSEMSSSLVTDTIREALQQEKVTDGLPLHSDQGSQYTSKAYFDLTQAYHVSPSMSSPGCPYDNAAMENFFGTLKTECLCRARFSSRAEVEQLVAEYIHFYNFGSIIKVGVSAKKIDKVNPIR